MTYLFDTDTLVFMVRGLKVPAGANPKQRERHTIARRIVDRSRRKQLDGHEIALSAITVAELEFGARHSGDYELEIGVVRRALSPFRILVFDAEDCAFRYGEVRHALESSGKGIGSLDTLIAAHAMAINATLVTNNTNEFSRVPGLRCENWAA